MNLKPCPFCGTDPELILIGNENTKKRAAAIRCQKIGCAIEMRVGAIQFDHAWCIDKAEEKWNTRINHEN